MTNGELERAMQFILEHQAQFASNQQRHDERIARLETNMAEMASAQSQTNEAVAAVARTQSHMNEVVAVMAETHRHTEEKLDAFIGVLERYISEGRDGRSNGGV